MPVCQVREIEAKSVLCRSALADYTINCYRGCQHGCSYCYARFVTRFAPRGEPWGEFVDVRVNAPEVLEREIKRAPRGRVFISSVCDGWQPVEAQYGLTRRCLEILTFYRYPVTILTKSGLASRDLDIVQGKGEIELGVTLTTSDESLRAVIESGASSNARRLALLQQAKERGVVTYAFLGPLMPYLSDTPDTIDPLLKELAELRVDYFYIDRLNPRPQVWASLSRMLQEHYPHLKEGYRRVLFQEEYRERYSRSLVAAVCQVARKYGLEEKMRVCYSW